VEIALLYLEIMAPIAMTASNVQKMIGVTMVYVKVLIRLVRTITHVP
jgi:hypothetical protein